VKLVWALALGVFLTGCAIQYRDGDGARHVVGFAHVVVREATTSRSQVVAQQVSTVGAAVLLLPEHSGIALGYTRNFSIQVSSPDEAGELSIPLSAPQRFGFKDFDGIQRELE